MFPFVETIRICEGKAENLSYHAARLQRTYRKQFDREPTFCLEEMLAPEIAGKSGICKCRVVYCEAIEQIELTPYQTPPIRNLMLIQDDTIRYALKSTDRHALDALRKRAVGCSDALIVQNGLITDTTFCNVALFDGYHWITPARPLLEGTRRAQLLDAGMLLERDIPATMVHDFKLIMLFNALNDFGTLMLPTHEIYYPF